MSSPQILEKLNKAFSLSEYHKQGFTDKRILEFIEKGKNSKTPEEAVKKYLAERLEPYRAILDCLRTSTLYFLCESRGVPDCIQYIKNAITSYVDNFISGNWKNIREGVFMAIDIPNEIFDTDKVFFRDFKIIVQIALFQAKYPLKTTENYSSYYADYNAVLKPFRGKDNQTVQKLTNGEIVLVVSELAQEWVEPLSRMIYHEFTHAYQDYNMLLKNQNYKDEDGYLKAKLAYGNSIDKLSDLMKNPQKRQEEYGKYEGLVIDCCNAVYALSKMEQNAFISQAYSEIDDYIRRRGSGFTYEEVIEHTSIYEMLYNLSDFLINLKATDSDGMAIVGYEMLKLNQKSPKTMNDCYKEYRKLAVRIEKAINNVYKKLTKLIGYHCSSANIYGRHGKINALYNRMRNLNKDK